MAMSSSRSATEVLMLMACVPPYVSVLCSQLKYWLPATNLEGSHLALGDSILMPASVRPLSSYQQCRSSSFLLKNIRHVSSAQPFPVFVPLAFPEAHKVYYLLFAQSQCREAGTMPQLLARRGAQHSCPCICSILRWQWLRRAIRSSRTSELPLCCGLCA